MVSKNYPPKSSRATAIREHSDTFKRWHHQMFSTTDTFFPKRGDSKTDNRNVAEISEVSLCLGLPFTRPVVLCNEWVLCTVCVTTCEFTWITYDLSNSDFRGRKGSYLSAGWNVTEVKTGNKGRGGQFHHCHDFWPLKGTTPLQHCMCCRTAHTV